MAIRLLLAALAAGFVAACSIAKQPPDPPAPEIRVVNECTWIQPLTFSRSDTPETKRQIIALADKIAANCPQYKPAQ